jgi:hypothetical protein
MDGFFWIVNPLEYAEILSEIYIPLKQPSTFFARDVFANLYTWEDNTIYCINVRYASWKVVGRKPGVFFNGIMTDWNYLMKQVSGEQYLIVKEKLGGVAYDECYGYFPLSGLGGSDRLEHLSKLR